MTDDDNDLTDRLRAHGRLGIVACAEAADRIEALSNRRWIDQLAMRGMADRVVELEAELDRINRPAPS